MERKIFICMKYFFIALPLVIGAITIVCQIYRAKYYTEYLLGNEDANALQFKAETFNDVIGEDIFEQYYYSVDGLTDIATRTLKNTNDTLSFFIPTVNVRISNQTYSMDIFNAVGVKVKGINNASMYISYKNSMGSQILAYLSYIVMIELYFMMLMLFRYFIHFGINLFERKKNL